MLDSKKLSDVNRPRRGSARLVWVVVAMIALAVAVVAQDATPLTLSDAAKMTLANNPMHKAALADTRATLAGVREARAPMLPRIMFAENYTRGNDPVFVFGAKLRQ
jgi:outer membrane protein